MVSLTTYVVTSYNDYIVGFENHFARSAKRPLYLFRGHNISPPRATATAGSCTAPWAPVISCFGTNTEFKMITTVFTIQDATSSIGSGSRSQPQTHRVSRIRLLSHHTHVTYRVGNLQVGQKSSGLGT